MHLKRGGFSPPTGSSVQELLVLRVSPPSLFPLVILMVPHVDESSTHGTRPRASRR